MPAVPAPLPPAVSGPTASDVLLDVEVERGALHFVLLNLGTAPAHAVRVRFGRSIRDLAGLRVNDNPLYRQLELLLPGRRLPLLVDTWAGYTLRRQPLSFEVRLTWRDDQGRALRRTLTHDLGAWAQWRQTL